MFTDYFYNAITKKAVTVFGTLFNNISIRRYESNNVVQNVKVPLSYGPKSKFLARIKEQADLTDQKLALKLPRMSFEITSFTSDTERKLNPLNDFSVVSPNNPQKASKAYTPVNYILSFSLFIYTKNADDMFQILEQILPFFTPEYTVTVKDLEFNGSRTDIPIILGGVKPSDEYEGEIAEKRTMIYDLSFSMKVPYVRPSKEFGQIKVIELNYINQETFKPLEQDIISSEDDSQ